MKRAHHLWSDNSNHSSVYFLINAQIFCNQHIYHKSERSHVSLPLSADTKPSCADRSRKRVSVSTVTSASSRTACRNCAISSVIQSTRPSCAVRSTVWASVRMDPGATLCTMPKRPETITVRWPPIMLNWLRPLLPLQQTPTAKVSSSLQMQQPRPLQLPYNKLNFSRLQQPCFSNTSNNNISNSSSTNNNSINSHSVRPCRCPPDRTVLPRLDRFRYRQRPRWPASSPNRAAQHSRRRRRPLPVPLARVPSISRHRHRLVPSMVATRQ